MRLKRLTLHGYKTFASRTSFEFTEGITAVVGPNGSGKSNIADAIRWVLGEQSYSTLRGKRTTDMIFAGSNQRSRAGMAQAILTLDNSAGWLPIDFSEIEIGRRAYRSGENEYLLNGQKVRLRDITELLASSGLAQRTYTIIGQGLVDQALSLRADERRLLFEEAAGVSHYKMRRAETLRRLQETGHNLERLHDILTEIRPRMNSLKRQANRARNYEQVAADLRYHLRIWYGYQWEQSKTKLRQDRYASEQAGEEWETKRGQLLAVQEELQRKRSLVTKLQLNTQEQEEQRDVIRAKLEDYRRDVAVLSERASAIKQQLEELADEMPRLQKQQVAARAELDQAVAELHSAQADYEENQRQLLQYQTALKATQDQITSWQQDVKRLRLERERVRDKMAQTEGEINQLQRRLLEIQEEDNRNSDLIEVEADIEKLQKTLELANNHLAQIEAKRDEKGQLRKNHLAELKRLRIRTDMAEHEASKLRDKASAMQARWNLLDQMRQDDALNTDDLPVLKRLVDGLRIPQEYQRAMEAALEHRLTAYLLPDPETLWKLSEANPDRRMVAAIENNTIISEPLKTPEHPKVVDWAENLVDADGEINELAQLLLRRVLVVQDQATAYVTGRSLPTGALAVSLNGFVAHPSGLIEFKPTSAGANSLAREEEWRLALEGLKQRQDTLASAQQASTALQNQVAKSQIQLEQFEKAETELNQQLNNKRSDCNQVQHTLDLARQKRDLLVEKHQSREAEKVRLTKQIGHLENTIVTDEEGLVKLQQSLEFAQQKLATLPVSETVDQNNQLRQQLETARTILAGRQAVVDSRRATLTQIDDLLRRREERRRDLQTQQQELNLEQQQAKLNELQGEMESNRASLQPLKEKLAQNRGDLSELEDDLSSLQRGSHELETLYTQARIELSQSENQIEGLRERITADLGLVALSYDNDQQGQTPLPIAEVVEQLPDVHKLPGDITETIQRYRGQLTRMGGFNPDAPAEYEEIKQRHDYMVQQIDDLTQTQEKLRTVIEDLDDQTSRAFATTVKQVDAQFGGVFKRLFGGGSAQLVLTDPDDLTLSGVDIVARLPRRREQGLALLSGGERSLTATALIFALLKVSPTPFCVLDEVDAMLDEANVNRFRVMLQELSEQTQFILITHNRGTVQVAETVYGVSMGSDSVSQVVSIRPDDYVNSIEETVVAG